MSDAEHDAAGQGLTAQQMIELVSGTQARRDARDAQVVEAAGDVSLQLRIAREFSQHSHAEIAVMTGLDESIVHEIESGTHDATRSELERLGVALGIDFVIGKSSAA